jgi:transcriptional regulator with XRE-family HTH domain
MVEIARSIKLNLKERLKDEAFRRKFFWAESSAHIARQLIALRKRRELNQKQVAEKIGTQQSAISRAEQADYQNWSFTNIRKIADALNARVRVYIEPAEDVLQEYDEPSETPVAINTARTLQAWRVWAKQTVRRESAEIEQSEDPEDVRPAPRWNVATPPHADR